MARTSAPLLVAAVLGLAALASTIAFVPPAAESPQAPALRGGAATAAAVYGGLAAAVPEPASAWTEQELNKAGLFFMVFFIFFFVAGLARMLTVGKL